MTSERITGCDHIIGLLIALTPIWAFVIAALWDRIYSYIQKREW
jgi:hypothetical protein